MSDISKRIVRCLAVVPSSNRSDSYFVVMVVCSEEYQCRHYFSLLLSLLNKDAPKYVAIAIIQIHEDASDHEVREELEGNNT